MKTAMDLCEINAILGSHEDYWASQQNVMNNLTLMYKQRLFSTSGFFATGGRNASLVIEPPFAHSIVDTFMSNLSPKAPAVTCGADIKGQGEPAVVQVVCNRALYDQSPVIDRWMQTSIVYPFSFMKLALLPDGKVDSVVDQIDMRPVQPWDVVVDFDADKYENSRYVGHRYWMPVKEAKKRWNVKFRGIPKKKYLNTVSYGMDKGTPEGGSDLLSYVEVYELYDIQNDELIFYSRNAERTDKVIDVVTPIPFRRYDGRPLVPMVPLYFHTAIDVPLHGESVLLMQFDSIVAKITSRTVYANGVAKEARQLIALKGSFDTEAKAKFSENRDGGLLEIDAPPGTNIGHVVLPLINQPLSSDFLTYEAQTDQDISTGTMLGRFTQGVITGASATEVAASTQFSSSVLNNMAHIRDRGIEQIAEVYSALIAFLLLTGEDAETLTINDVPVTIAAKDFIGKFKFSAADQTSTPIGAAIQRQNIMALLPTLQGLGVSNESLLEQIKKSFDLPSTIVIEKAPEAAPTAVSAPSPDQLAESQGVNQPLSVGGGQVSAAIRSTLP